MSGCAAGSTPGRWARTRPTSASGPGRTDPAVRILVVNPGSSSLKLSVLGDSDDPLLQEDLPTPPAEDGAPPLDGFLDRAGELDAVGVRIVHGGARLRQPALVDDGTLRLLDEACTLAPLHNPAAIAA